MKLLWILLTYFASVHSSSLVDNERLNGVNGWYVPRKDGSFEWYDLQMVDKLLDANGNVEDIKLTKNPVRYYLYTKSNPDKYQKIVPTNESINSSNFNVTNPTRIIIHGWGSSKDDYLNRGVRQAWLSQGDFNMISVDWSRGRSVDYVSSVMATKGVGKKIASFVDFLVKNYDLKLNDLEIIGHSLGAHVAGFTGKKITSGQPFAIIGLDPALPMFSYNKPDGRLSNSDAYYVETIQTNGGQLGFLQPIGKGAFYPNGGKIQPGCKGDITGSCSHGRSVTYYIEAIIINNFASIKCKNYSDAVANNCGTQYSSVRMGAVNNAYMVNGSYLVPVNNKSPFGMLS
uniref:Lipase domain-containing protein n=1 Tax=Glossina brevipalpis TaxID=37001 RepID=A0A1A9VZB6_9MUSC